MGIREDLTKDIAVAMKAGEKLRLGTLRLLLSAVKNKEIDTKKPLTDEEFQQTISTMCKQRRESIEQFEAGGRQELADQERGELEILMAFLPEQLTEEEVRAIITAAKEELGVTSPKEMGKLMGAVMPKVKGKADGKLVQAIVKELLGAG